MRGLINSKNRRSRLATLVCAQILDAKYVLLICTESYRNRFLGLEEFGKGRGSKMGGKVIQNILYYKGDQHWLHSRHFP
jgi:hypothetical protein